jgi:hypothetical protein
LRSISPQEFFELPALLLLTVRGRRAKQQFQGWDITIRGWVQRAVQRRLKLPDLRQAGRFQPPDEGCFVELVGGCLLRGGRTPTAASGNKCNYRRTRERK